MSYSSLINVKSSYTLLTSLIKLEQYIGFAKKNNLQQLFLIDQNNMYGVFEFYKLCKKNNIKPIIGISAFVDFNDQDYEFIFIAKNYQGYKNLIKLSSQIMIDKEQSIAFENITNSLDDLFIIINFSPENIDSELYNRLSSWNNNLYLGVNLNNISSIEKLLNLTSNIVFSQPIYYLDQVDFNTFQVLEAIKKQVDINQINLKNEHFYFSEAEMNKSMYHNLLIENNLKIINQCNLEIVNEHEIHSKNIINYPCPDSMNSEKYLQTLCRKGLESRFGRVFKKIYYERMVYELEIINQMGFADYFLVVWDYVNFAKSNKIAVGPGRGSVAGSLVAYLLNITEIDPIEYNLLFERFLNPERLSLPDIDIDFQDDRREEVVEYLFNKYGQNHVANIVTFQTIGMKMAIRDCARVYNIDLEIVDKMAKLVDNEYNFQYHQALANNKFLKNYEQKYPIIFKHIQKIIFLPRQTGTHAAGVVLSQKPLTEILPVRDGYLNIYQTQYSMNYLEELGLLKMDILGLRNLTILNNIVEQVKQDLNIDFDLAKINLDDQNTFSLLQQGKTSGIFQLESIGMKNVLMEMHVNSLEDIVATSSLYRPGPQDNIASFIARKFNKETIDYIDPRLKPILQSTYGIIVYQEQVILLAKLVANFSLAKADNLRRAMGKKDYQIMDRLKDEFIANAILNNYNETIANSIWDLTNKFASYGFNRSHAVAYSLISYQMAYLKANYPTQFFASLLTSVIGAEGKTLEYINEVKSFDLKIVPPTVNNPCEQYITTMDQIKLPLLIIKQVGPVFVEKLQENFNKYGEFTDIFNFYLRMRKNGLNNKVFQALVYSGTLDEFDYNRTTLINAHLVLQNYADIVHLESSSQDDNIIDESLATKPTIKIYSEDEINKLNKEFEYLGFYLSAHPLSFLRNKLGYWKTTTLISKVNVNAGFISIMGSITRIKEINDKQGHKMAFVELTDESGKIDVTFFADKYKNHEQILQVNNILLLNIRLQTYHERTSGIANQVKLIESNK